MIIKFDRNLSTQEIYANGEELASTMGMDRDSEGNKIYTYPETEKILVAKIKNPVLMTDIHKIASMEPSIRDTIMQLLKSNTTITEYDGTALKFEQNKYPGLWGPNIDTIMMCRALHEVDLSATKLFAEAGAGSGFITKYVLENNESIERALAIDINAYSGKCIENNIQDSRLEFRNEDAKATLENNKIDTLICNPPYILRPNSVEDNAYEGLELFKYLIEKSDSYLSKKGMIISNISSISEKEALEICKNHEVETLHSMEVPLKVTNIYNNKEWLKFLLGKTGLREEHKHGYPYWHTISAVKITKK